MLAPSIKANLIECIELSYQTDNETKEKFLSLLTEGTNAVGKYTNTHFTSSSFVINQDQSKALLMFHKKYEKWLPFGGHWIEDIAIQETLLQSAYREMFEEGFNGEKIPSFSLYNSQPIDLDIHEAKDHVHYDFAFLIQVNDTTKTTLSNESIEIKWIPLMDIAMDNKNIFNDRIVRLAQKSLELTKKPVHKHGM